MIVPRDFWGYMNVSFYSLQSQTSRKKSSPMSQNRNQVVKESKKV